MIKDPTRPGYYSASNQLLLRRAAQARIAAVEKVDDEVYEAAAHGRPVAYLEFVAQRTSAGWS